MADLAEMMARAFHEGLLDHPQCVAWTWDELSDEHRAWKIAAAQHVIDELGLTVEHRPLPVFVDDDPPAFHTELLGGENLPRRHVEFIPHTRQKTAWHGDQCPDCAAEPGIHDRRHAEILAAARSGEPANG